MTGRRWRLERGITRTVLLTRRWAIKVPSLRGGSGRGRWSRARFFVYGWEANLDELEWFPTYNDGELRVAPVRRSWLGGLIQVYPRCEPFVSVEDDPAGHALDDAPRLPYWDDDGDLKHDNLGYLQDADGRRCVVWLDYARTAN